MIDAWWYFWTFSFGVAGLGFFLIAAVVLFCGVGDLKKMIGVLTSRSTSRR